MALTLLLAQILDCVMSYDKMEERKRRIKGCAILLKMFSLDLRNPRIAIQVKFVSNSFTRIKND